ncbi:hypothetical protein [Agrilutibacter solisilvae]|uniref:Uncharacterized protein n=1 Tax=Agrilutibacter solisilvae TaxID=2763317 RepID=A0A975AS24_9GAMM|nr:hypothetical protein [Lysobacter solisilvae]QSX78322.1 hypothetical protein I8J32_016990 [Lysobacter solisilvae]
MGHPLISRGQPHRFRNMARADFVLAALAGCLWLDLLPFESEWLDLVPSWAWLILMLLLLASGIRTYRLHRRQLRTPPA